MRAAQHAQVGHPKTLLPSLGASIVEVPLASAYSPSTFMCILPDGMAPRGTMPSEARTTCGKHYGSICQVQQHLKRAPSCVRRCCELHPHLRRTRSHGSKCQGNAPAKSSKLFQGPPATCHRPCRGFSQIAQDFQTTTTFFLNCSVTLICSRHWHSFLDRRVPRSKVSGRPSLHSCSLLAADVARRSWSHP